MEHGQVGRSRPNLVRGWTQGWPPWSRARRLWHFCSGPSQPQRARPGKTSGPLPEPAPAHLQVWAAAQWKTVYFIFMCQDLYKRGIVQL